MGLKIADHLEPVLEPAQEPVRPSQAVGVGLGDVALVRERAERAKGVRVAKAVVSAPMHDLQQLDGELDVANPAPPSLDLDGLLAAGANVLLEPDLDLADLLDRLRLQLLRIDERRDAPDEQPSELEISAAAAEP